MDGLKLKLDLHVHSRYSRDSRNSFEAINRRCRELGLDGYAVCDHDCLDGLREAGEKSGGLVVIPGLEVTARRAHILCLNPVELVPSRLSIVETVERIHGQGATSVIAHPYGIPRSLVGYGAAKEAGFDAVEVVNSAQFPFRLVTGWSVDLAERLGLPQTGGSDSHIPETFGRSYTVVDSDSKETEDVIRAIKLGRTEPIGSATRLVERLQKLWRVMVSRDQ